MGLSKLVDKLKKTSIDDLNPAAPAVTPGQAPLKKQVYQARHNFGVNFGALFVGEKWIFHEPFPDGTDCELAAVAKSVKENGKDGAKQKLESHWTSYASDDDWAWLRDHGVTGIRIPIGYWDVNGGRFTKGTKFEPFAQVYSSAWDIFKSHYMDKAAQYGIGVLVDMHGLPGGANGQDHSGEKNGGSADFWGNSTYEAIAVDAVKFIAGDLKKYENLAGIQIVNESEFSNDAKKQKAYYSKAINAIRSEDSSVPVVISDGWWPDQFAKWIQDMQGADSVGVVIDHHCYRCFDDRDKGKSAEKIIGDLNSDLLTNINDDGSGVDFMVGEWSCVLDGKTWQNSGLDPNDWGNDKRAMWVAQYAQRQLQLIFERAGYGLFFWTFKFQSGNGGEWDFKQQLGNTFHAPKVSVPDDSQRAQALEARFNDHANYWNGQNQKEKYEHERFKDGFNAAWSDSVEFAKQGSLIGRRQAVKQARLKEHVSHKGKLNFLWEWEGGYDQGIAEFNKAAVHFS